MLTEEIIEGDAYVHEVYGVVTIVKDVTNEWEYWQKQGKGVWKVYQYNSGRSLLAIDAKYFSSRYEGI